MMIIDLGFGMGEMQDMPALGDEEKQEGMPMTPN
jgi:hypothetical protein